MPARSITTFQGSSETAIEHDAALDHDSEVAAVGAVAALALEAERLRATMRIRGENGSSSMRNGGPALAGVLTPREREVLALAAEGLTDAAIAERLYVVRRTVEAHLGRVFEKLELPAGRSQNRRVHAVRRYLEAN
jgi:DNA-binding NarL/FixJ family response regulator